MNAYKPGWMIYALLCGCSDGTTDGLPRTEVTAALVADVMIPAHAELTEQTTGLAALAGFCSEGATVGLGEVHDAWRRSHQAMGRTEAFGYGPAQDDHYGAALLFWSTRPENLEAVVLGADPIDRALVDSLGATSKGLPAIEAQLFDPIGGDVAVLARFDPTDPAGARRCALVGLLAADASASAESLHQAWAPGGFGSELVQAGAEGSRYRSSRAALDEIVNGVISLLERIDDTKLGKPLGSGTGGMPQPALVLAPWADDSIAMIRANLGGVMALWHGGGGLGLRDLVAPRSEPLAASVDAGLEDADQALAEIDGPLRTAITSSPQKVQAAIDRFKHLRRLFTVDVSQQLDVTITLSDNDGD